MKNESVFPQTKTAGDVSLSVGGMTLRDYFAAKAMQALIEKDNNCGRVNQDVADTAYWYADAMLAQRERDDD